MARNDGDLAQSRVLNALMGSIQDMSFTAYRYLLLLPALGPLIYYLLAIWAARNFFRPRNEVPPDAAFLPPCEHLETSARH